MKITIELSPDEISNGREAMEVSDIVGELTREKSERDMLADGFTKAEQPPQEPKYKQGKLMLRELISERDLTLQEVADDFGLKYGTFLSWVSGDREPNLTTLCVLADYFGVTVDKLLGRTKNPIAN